MIDLHAFTQPFEGWNKLYSHSKAISTTVISIHLGAMFLGGGLAIAADRATLRVAAQKADERARQLAEIADVHRPVIIGLVFLAISGVAMALADLENFLTNPVFWVKLSLVALLLINGAVLQSVENGLRKTAAGSGGNDRWSRLRSHSVLSLVLWTATFLAGSILTNAT